MFLFKQKTDLEKYLQPLRDSGHAIGFVPTMGALHAGHLSLIARAREETEKVVCSIFVNPTQFNDPNDFEKYPITLERDIEQLVAANTDVLFLPAVGEIYPEGHPPSTKYDFGDLDTILEGQYRPGHFQGVGQVVHRLLDIVMPEKLFLGQKDFQQCLILKQLLKLLHSPVKIVVVPTLREPDGLAMSSRNVRLSAQDRTKATTIYKALIFIREHLYKTSFPILKAQARAMLEKEGFKVDYVEIAAAENLQALEAPLPKSKMVALIAAALHDVRLIDNLLLDETGR